jgi:hypothetical protein
MVSGITAGLVAASATAGALLGFGFRLGAPAQPFNAIGAILLGAAAQQVRGFAPGPTIVGVVLHIATLFGAGIVYASLLDRASGHPVAWAGAMGAGGLAVILVVARLFGVGLGVLLPLGSLVVLCVVLALALVIGMRLALPQV